MQCKSTTAIPPQGYQEEKPRVRSVSDAARALGVSTGTLYRLRKAGKLRVTKLGGRTLVLESEIDRVLAEETTHPPS
ncbi:MAG TPA: helix-turn-helix domain-containing protein [Methylocystis sp.]